MRLAITGASGFCGSAVAVAAARSGADVICLGRRPGAVGQHTHWDAASEVPDLAGADAVIHLAAAVGDPGRRAEAAFRAVNVAGTQRLLAAAAGRPVVFVSSASVYDPRADRSCVREDHPVGGHLNGYGRTKAAGDRLALDAGAVVLRPHAVYGTGDRHLEPRLRRALRGNVLPLPGPDVRLSLTAVENLADACLAALSWPPGPYNIADALPYSRDEAVTGLFGARGLGVRIIHVPVPLASAVAALAQTRRPAESFLSRYAVDQLSHDFVLDIAQATAQGWVPRRSLADYLAELA